MPAGRMPVRALVGTTPEQRRKAEEMIRVDVAAGRQAFVICPLVEESSALEAKAAESEYARIKAEVFPELRVGLIHGRMRSQEKEETMNAVRAGQIDVLVATTVIEVGVDIPNASVMIVEDADRFGLSQLEHVRLAHRGGPWRGRARDRAQATRGDGIDDRRLPARRA